MNQFRSARDRLLNVNDAVSGSPQTAKISGKTVRCIIEEITSEEIEISGGRAESGGFRLSCIPKESLAPKPEKGDSVEARDQDLEQLTIVEFNDATFTIVAGSLNRGE
jgi:hypothetical protein